MSLPILKRLAYFQETLQNRVQYAEANLSNFKKSLDKDPSHAFEWADKMFAAAADIRIAKELLHWMGDISVATEDGATKFFASVRAGYAREIQQSARSPSRSTSPSSNLMAQELLAVRAWVLDNIP